MPLRNLALSIREVLKVLVTAASKVPARIVIISKLAHKKNTNEGEKCHVSVRISTHVQ
jgi:hypothetical protein